MSQIVKPDQITPPGAKALERPRPQLDLAALNELEKQVVEAVRTCYDPEIPVNIFELGLVYEVKADPSGEVVIRMTLTSPACPVAGSLPQEVQRKAAAITGVTGVKVDLVWDPPWDPSFMSEAARLQLGFF